MMFAITVEKSTNPTNITYQNKTTMETKIVMISDKVNNVHVIAEKMKNFIFEDETKFGAFLKPTDHRLVVSVPKFIDLLNQKSKIIDNKVFTFIRVI